MWFIFALLSALFAALTSILAKIGISGVNSNLATAIRTLVVVVMAWGMVFLTNTQKGISEISQQSWLFLIRSLLAVLLPGAAAGGGLQGGPYRQTQRGIYPDSRLRGAP